MPASPITSASTTDEIAAVLKTPGLDARRMNEGQRIRFSTLLAAGFVFDAQEGDDVISSLWLNGRRLKRLRICPDGLVVTA